MAAPARLITPDGKTIELSPDAYQEIQQLLDTGYRVEQFPHVSEIRATYGKYAGKPSLVNVLLEERKADQEAVMEMVKVNIELPREIFSALRQDPAGFVREMRAAAAVKWYENGVVSQGKAAEIAGLSRSEFINALNQFKVSAFQYSADEIVAEVTHR